MLRRLSISTHCISSAASDVYKTRVGGQVDGRGLGIWDQDGDSLFIQRFALGSHKDYSATHSMRFALEHQNALISGNVLPVKGVSPETIFFSVSSTKPTLPTICVV